MRCPDLFTVVTLANDTRSSWYVSRENQSVGSAKGLYNGARRRRMATSHAIAGGTLQQSSKWKVLVPASEVQDGPHKDGKHRSRRRISRIRPTDGPRTPVRPISMRTESLTQAKGLLRATHNRPLYRHRVPIRGTLHTVYIPPERAMWKGSILVPLGGGCPAVTDGHVDKTSPMLRAEPPCP